MAEQCSQTNLQPLYLLPNTASFYTWIPAVGFARGGPKKNWQFFFSTCKMRQTASVIFFSVNCPGDEQCRYMCQSHGESFIVSRGSQFADGTRCESDSPPPFGATAACLRGKCQVKKTQQDQTCQRADAISLPHTFFFFCTQSLTHLFNFTVSLWSAVWLWWCAALWESKRCVWSVWWRWIQLHFDLWLLHWWSGSR